ncbi:MAG: hypothetical protein LBS98_06390 [Coriobacteriales bacterium]|jgi:hypothetical protein|nr:hypothetical protein [Coriobacteriales bacterium]
MKTLKSAYDDERWCNTLIGVMGSKVFIVTLSVGFLIALAHIIITVIPFALEDKWELWRLGAQGSYPPSVLSAWLGASAYSSISVLYYLVLPLLVCIPCLNILRDRASGKIINPSLGHTSFICSLKWYLSKISISFIVAGIIAIAPLIFNFLLTSLFLPSLPPEAASGNYLIYSTSMFANLFFDHPVLYILVFFLMTFVVGGILASWALASVFIFGNRIVAIAAPFIVSISLLMLLGENAWAGYVPANLLAPYQPFPLQLHNIVLIYSILFAGVIAFFLAKAYRGQKHAEAEQALGRLTTTLNKVK